MGRCCQHLLGPRFRGDDGYEVGNDGLSGDGGWQAVGGWGVALEGV